MKELPGGGDGLRLVREHGREGRQRAGRCTGRARLVRDGDARRRRPHDPVKRAAFLALQALDGFANTHDHAAGRLPDVIRAAGFQSVMTHARLWTAWGSLELLSADNETDRVA